MWLNTLINFSPRWLVFLPLIFLCWKPRKKRILAAAVFVVIDLYAIMGFRYTPTPEEYHTPDLRILSYNMGGGSIDVSALKQVISEQNINLIMLQESGGAILNTVAPKSWNKHCYSNLCVASSYKLTPMESQKRRFLGGWGDFTGLYQLALGSKNIHVQNVHLDTPRRGLAPLLHKKLDGLNALKQNLSNRDIESNIASQWSKATPASIVAGDFNMPQESALYREYWSHLQNTFSESGQGLGYTKSTRWLGVRIDHILASDSFEVLDFHTLRGLGGDHNPVVASVKLIEG